MVVVPRLSAGRRLTFRSLRPVPVTGRLATGAPSGIITFLPHREGEATLKSPLANLAYLLRTNQRGAGKCVLRTRIGGYVQFTIGRYGLSSLATYAPGESHDYVGFSHPEAPICMKLRPPAKILRAWRNPSTASTIGKGRKSHRS